MLTPDDLRTLADELERPAPAKAALTSQQLAQALAPVVRLYVQQALQPWVDRLLELEAYLGREPQTRANGATSPTVENADDQAP